MTDTRVLRHRIGSMPMRVELAMANALMARRFRAAPSYHLSSSMVATVERARQNVQQYRANRTWVFGGEPHTYNHQCTG